MSKEILRLTELLNEYEKEERNHQTSRTYEYNGFHYIDYGMIYSEFLMLSKKYGFIKWLVENEKIETNNLNLKVFKSMFSNDGTVEISYEELVLMLLAISDEPIEFLISILKNV